MKRIECVIFVEPVPKARARVVMAHGRVMAYTPARTRAAEADIKAAIRGELVKAGCGSGPLFEAGVPLRLSVTFYRDRPASLPKRVTMPVKKPDLDNYEKCLLDSLNRYLFPDDAAVCSMIAKKRFGSPPRIELVIEEDLP